MSGGSKPPMETMPDAEQPAEQRIDEEAGPEVDQPGLGKLREAVANRRAPSPPGGPGGTLRQDVVAGLNSAISSVPDGMASGILAGVSPIYGLYACMVGPLVGGIFSSTQLMVISTTRAAALAAGQALSGLAPETRDTALFLMVILVGAFQVLFGLLGLGRLIRFVSYSVMTGFLSGIAVLTVLSQLPTVAGYEPAGSNKVTQTFDLLAHAGQWNLLSLALAGSALVLAVLLPRTALGHAGSLVAIIVPSVVVVLFQMTSVQIVQDISPIPTGIPLPALPSLSGLTFDSVTGALAVAAIILVQGAGVSQSVRNPDGSPRRVSRDFIGQGAANIASGFFRGLPVGGSLSSTALIVVSGAGSRLAVIFAGLWMALIVVVFPGLVSYVAMPALGALLILASASAIKPAEIRSIWKTGWSSRLAIIATFLATLLLPIQVAVGLGVVLSAALYVNESSTDISVVELVQRPDGRIEERKSPRELPAGKVTVLDVYGNLFYAGARTLERLLPAPRNARNPVVLLRLRGHTTVGATLIDVLARYADKLRAVHGRLYLTGISQAAHDQLADTGKLRLSGPVRVYEATPIVGESTREAYADAQTWLVDRAADGPPDAATGATATGPGSLPM